ncbi:MAG: Activator of Hsp90 ATPase 1 family protein [Ilumatobacteraceae bacterium]|nr:Activator of Hsp90 ATPase 1 family protein [Ilumatobacteraceae bacterium]
MEPVSLHRTVELEISVDSLWALVADPARLGEWLGDDVRFDISPDGLEPGAAGVVVDDGITRFVHVDRVAPGRALGFTWWEADGGASRVELEVVEQAGGGSRLEITETLAETSTATMSAGSADAAAAEAQLRWEVRVGALWACTVVAALVR